MPIYSDIPDDGFVPRQTPLVSSLGIGPKVTKAIDEATRKWLDDHPEATTTVEDDSLTNSKFMDGSVDSRVIEDESITTNDIADLAITTPKIADDAVTAQKITSSAVDGLRTMSATQLGVAKVGAGLAMNGDALELDGNGDIATAVQSWLDAHPEATTTVQDGAITNVKIADNTITDAKLVQSGGIFEEVHSGQTVVPMTPGEYIRCNYSAGTYIDLSNPAISDSYRLGVVTCLPGDKFVLNCTGLSGARAWCVLDSEQKIISAASSNATLTNYVLTIPTNGAYLIINDTNTGGISYKGMSRINAINQDSQTIVTSNIKNYETDGSYAYLALGGSGTNRSIWMRSRVHNLIDGNNNEWRTLGLIADSPSGFTNCWKIPYGKSLVFNIDRQAPEIASESYDGKNFILIAYVGTDGQLFTNKDFHWKYMLNIERQRIDDIEDREDKTYLVPSYFEDELADTIDKVRVNINSDKTAGTYGTDIESFIFITDPHWAYNKKHSPGLIKRIVENTSVSTIICGGDIVYSHNATKEGAIDEIRQFSNAMLGIPTAEYFCVFGNHDDNSNTNSDISIMLTKDEQYNVMHSSFANRKNVHFSFEEADNAAVKNDYYVDHPRTKTRYLCIDWNNPVNGNRAQWISSVLSRNDGYRVIVIYHGIYSSVSGGTPVPEHTQVMSVLEPYKSKIVAMFTGHCHEDYVSDYYGDGSLHVILSMCDKFTSEVMTEGTDTEQCFDVVTIDYGNNLIKMTRVGLGSDRTVQFTLS